MTTHVLPSHEVRDDTSGIALRVRGGSLAELVEEAGRALAAVELAGADCVPGGLPRRIRVSALEPEALLAEWLNELIFLAQTDGWVAVDFTVNRADETAIDARVWGLTLDRPPSRLHSATLQALRVEEIPGGWEAEILLDE